MTHIRRCQLLLPAMLCLAGAACAAGLHIENLGKIAPGLSAEDDHNGAPAKWEAVHNLLGDAAGRVLLKQCGADLGGNTSIRNSSPLVWKDKGYFRRARDLGQVFTAPEDFTLDAIVLRTGNDTLAFLPGASGAEMFVQFFEVEGTPVIDDNGTPPGTDATHGFSTNHRCDDFLRGVTYEPWRVLEGGRMPDLAAGGDGKLTYMKWRATADDPITFRAGQRYAFMVGFATPAPERNLTLANRNNAASPAPPRIQDEDDTYGGGWSLRREGNGKTPPTTHSGAAPPDDPELRALLEHESSFPTDAARYAIPPTCEGYPDVDTYRDLEFYILERTE